ncbi:hypothetical protein F0239_25695 [Vibrio jasicida]|nr:hypothetical protein [Vibrio jasicida]
MCILTLNQGYVTPIFEFAHNKAFKSDSQRLAFSLRSSIAKRRSHLNAALCLLVFQRLKYLRL